MNTNYYNCIYMYVNKINGRRYVGQAKDFNRRHKEHKAQSSHKTPIDKAFKKYGEENFEIKILAENIPTQEKMNEYEKFFIKRYDTLIKNGMGYNISDGGSNGNPLAGKTEEEIEEIKRKQSENACRHWEGKHLSDETKQKLSEARKGQKLSETTKQKIKNNANNNPNYGMKGKNHSEEAKRKMSESHKNMPEDTRQKIKDSWTEERKKEQSNRISGINSPNLGVLIERWTKDGVLVDIKYRFEYQEMGFHHSEITRCCDWYDFNQDREMWNKKYKNRRPNKSVKGYIFKFHK